MTRGKGGRFYDDEDLDYEDDYNEDYDDWEEEVPIQSKQVEVLGHDSSA
jgi:hypothetical protein